jgi:hypothetical protein
MRRTNRRAPEFNGLPGEEVRILSKTDLAIKASMQVLRSIGAKNPRPGSL